MLEQKISQYHNALMDNGAVPSKIIAPREPSNARISKDELQEKQRDFEQMFKGVGSQGKTLISAAPLEVHSLASSVKDMELLKLLDFTAKEIEIAFGLPHGILQSETVNVADGRNSKNALIEYTIVPMVKEVLEVLNNTLIERYGGRLFYNVVFPTMEDSNAEATRLGTLVEKGIITQDEARQELGYAQKGGEADELPLNMATQVARRAMAKSMIRDRVELRTELEVQAKEMEKLKKKH